MTNNRNTANVYSSWSTYSVGLVAFHCKSLMLSSSCARSYRFSVLNLATGMSELRVWGGAGGGGGRQHFPIFWICNAVPILNAWFEGYILILWFHGFLCAVLDWEETKLGCQKFSLDSATTSRLSWPHSTSNAHSTTRKYSQVMLLTCQKNC